MTGGREALDRDVLRAPSAGGRVIRGGVVRGVGYVVGIAVATATASLLFRYLGVADFGRYATVTALLGIVAGVTDAGLTAVGSREMSIRPPGAQRDLVLANLVLIRLAATAVGVLAACGFAAAAGYDSTMVLGTVVGGIGIALLSGQTMMTMPLSVDLRILALTALDLLKQVVMLVGVAALVVTSATLLPFFGVTIPVAVIMIVATTLVLRRVSGLLPRYDPATARVLVRQTLPLAVAFTMNIVYFRVLVILVSLLGTEIETGIFGTSFRIFETLLVAPALVLGVALPLLSVAGHEDDERLRYALQRMTEISMLAGALLVLGIGVLAEPAIQLVGGEEYADAAPVLRIQGVALLFVILGQTWQLALVAAHGQRVMAIANAVALALVLLLGFALIPSHGATGAAWAAVIAEVVLAAGLWLGIRRVRPTVTPSLRAAWKVMVAVGCALVPLLIFELPVLIELSLATGLFLATAFVLRAIPPELARALQGRA